MTYESSKNTKALATTIMVHVLLLLLFILIKFPKELIGDKLDTYELSLTANLGTSDQGMGIDQPELPGNPAPQNEPDNNKDPFDNTPSGNNTKVANMASSAEHKHITVPAKSIETTNNSDAPHVKALKDNTVTQKANDKKVVTHFNENQQDKGKNKGNIQNSNSTANTESGANNHPKHLLTALGGNGTGGNGSTNYHPSTGEGNGNKPGDKGSLNGSPKGLSYTSGVSGRTLVEKPNNHAEYNEGGVVKVMVRVDRKGNIIGHSILSSSNSTIRNITEQKLASLKYNASPNADPIQTGIVYFTYH